MAHSTYIYAVLLLFEICLYRAYKMLYEPAEGDHRSGKHKQTVFPLTL